MSGWYLNCGNKHDILRLLLPSIFVVVGFVIQNLNKKSVSTKMGEREKALLVAQEEQGREEKSCVAVLTIKEWIRGRGRVRDVFLRSEEEREREKKRLARQAHV